MAAISQPSRPTIHDPLSHPNTSSGPVYTSNTNTRRSSTASPTEYSPDGPIASLNNYRQQHHLSTSSTSSISKTQRSGGILAFAAAAIDKTQSAFANISEPVVRPRQSNAALSRLSPGLDPAATKSEPGSPDKSARFRSSSNNSSGSSATLVNPPAEGNHPSQVPLVKDPPSQPYSETDSSRPPPIRLPSIENKMHQTSSRLLRMTDDDRPFTRVRTDFVHLHRDPSQARNRGMHCVGMYRAFWSIDDGEGLETY
jgi:GTPase-activating protein SST2